MDYIFGELNWMKRYVGSLEKLVYLRIVEFPEVRVELNAVVSIVDGVE